MVYVLGESLLDIIFKGGKPISATAGGSMLNVSVSLARSGVEVSLISETGDDKTAEIILDFLNKNKVKTKYVKRYYHQKTTIALAHLDQKRIPFFTIYKSYPENRRLITPTQFAKGDILVFGSVYSLDPAIRNEIIEIVSLAKRGGALIIYDPNIRKSAINRNLLETALRENFAFADIIKGSDKDFETVFGGMSLDQINIEIRKVNPDAALIITRGNEGVTAYSLNKRISLPAMNTKVVSTIGAGDAFNAGLACYIEKLKNKNIKEFTSSNAIFEGMLKSGLQYAAEVCATMENYIPEYNEGKTSISD